MVDATNTRVFVGNLAWSVNDEDLRSAFDDGVANGAIRCLEALVAKERDTTRSRGFGFVVYATEDEANAAVAAMNERDINGRNARVNIDPPNTRVYVGNLAWSVDDEVLRSAFDDGVANGAIRCLEALVVKERESNRSRGFGFVVYATEDEANAAVAAMNERDINGRNAQVNIAQAKGSAPPGSQGGGGRGRGGRGGRRGGGRERTRRAPDA